MKFMSAIVLDLEYGEDLDNELLEPDPAGAVLPWRSTRNTDPLSEIVSLHNRLHEQWRWYGVPYSLRRLYELWDEIEQEDQAKRAAVARRNRVRLVK